MKTFTRTGLPPSYPISVLHIEDFDDIGRYNEERAVGRRHALGSGERVAERRHWPAAANDRQVPTQHVQNGSISNDFFFVLSLLLLTS